MNNYYGLRLMRFLYGVLAWIIAITSLVAATNILAPYLTTGQSVDIRPALGYLIIGGTISLTCYVFSQLIEILIRHNTMLQEQSVMMAEMNEKFDRLVEILANKRTKQAVSRDIKQRRERLLKQSEEAAKIPVQRE